MSANRISAASGSAPARTGMMFAVPELIGAAVPAGRLSSVAQPEIVVDELVIRVQLAALCSTGAAT